MRQSDGSITNSYFNVGSQPTGNNVYREGSQLMLGQIEKVHFVDEATNISKKFVEYDVSVRDSKGGQSIYKNVRCAYPIFGTNDFQEMVLEANEYSFQDKLDTQNFFKNKNGSLVILGFLNSNLDKPFILSALQHPRMDNGAKKADGIRLKGEFRGLQYSINKLGEFALIYKGDRKADGKFVRPDTAPTSIRISQTGALTVSDKENQQIQLDRVAKTIAIEQYEGTKTNEVGGDPAKSPKEPSFTNGALVNSIKLNKAAKSITIKSGNVTIVVDGTNDKVQITTKSGNTISIDGNSGTFETICDTAKIGKNASFHATLAENVITYNDAHIHLAPQAPGGILPTQTPLLAMGAYAGTVLDPTALKILLKGNS